MQKNLFSFDEPMVPDESRSEPAIWLKKVVLLKDADPSQLIRDPIEFHRGFNLIRTEPRLKTDASVIAHSVGKTLLMRLIRHSLGEETFASEEGHFSLLAALPTAHLVCEWRVSQKDWIVARPFHDHTHGASWCNQTDDWRSIFSDKEERVPYGRFLESVHHTTTDGLPDFENAKGQKPKWLDILGWLARDCECGYRKSNEWRHADINLGKPGDLDFNRLLMQWLTGLMSPLEAELRREGWNQLGDRGKAKRSAERFHRDAFLLEESLRSAMDQPRPEADSDEDSAPSFAPIAIVEIATESFQKQINVLKRAYGLDAISKEVSDLQVKLNTATKVAGKASGELSSSRSVQNLMKKSQADKVDLNRCPSDPCQLRQLLDEEKKMGADKAKPDMAEVLEGEIKTSKDKKKQADDELERLTETLKTKRSEFYTKRDEYYAKFGELQRLKGQWESHLASAKRYDGVVKDAIEQETIRDKMESLEKDTQAKLDSERESMDYKKKVTNFSNFYSQVLRQIFEVDSNSKIGVDGNGIKVEPDKKLAPGGRALSAMAQVATFDLACVAASMMGIGNHPRFLMHDSPREGEMEPELFVKLFDLACFLESLSNGDEPSFQYIVTTTTPPEKYQDDNGHTIIALHGRDGSGGRLLRTLF